MVLSGSCTPLAARWSYCCVVSPEFFVAPFSGELLCTGGGVGVWVFECCCLLFLKGLLALPWGYCSRNSYLCYSPAYRLLTGTKWKNPAHSVLCFVNMFYCPWFSAICYSIFIFFFFPFVPTLPGKPCCSMITFIFLFCISCQYLCPFNLIITVEFKHKCRNPENDTNVQSHISKSITLSFQDTGYRIRW